MLCKSRVETILYNREQIYWLVCIGVILVFQSFEGWKCWDNRSQLYRYIRHIASLYSIIYCNLMPYDMTSKLHRGLEGAQENICHSTYTYGQHVRKGIQNNQNWIKTAWNLNNSPARVHQPLERLSASVFIVQ